jgi:hypothetical protein
MKKLVLLIALATGLIGAPDASYRYRFTNRTGETADNLITFAPGAGPAVNNTNIGCIAWQLTYASEGFSALSITLQTAPSGVTLSGLSTPSSTWSTFGGTATVGSLAMTSTSQGNYVGYGFYPYVRVNVTTTTGTGSIEVKLSCWTSITYANTIGSGGGGSGNVTGPGSSTDTAIAKFNGTNGQTIQNSGVTIDSSDNVSTPGNITSGVGSGNAGSHDFVAGTSLSIAANSFGWGAGSAMTTSVRLESPNAAPAAHSLMVLGAPTSNKASWAYKVLPDCQDSGGNHLNFTQSTDALSCGTSGGASSLFSTSGTGHWYPFDAFWSVTSITPLLNTTVPTYWEFAVPATFTLTEIRGHQTGAGNHYAFAIYDSTCTRVVTGSTVTSSAYAPFVSTVASTTLTPGVYFLAMASGDDAAVGIYGQNSTLGPLVLNAATVKRIFTGSNTISGTTTITFPSTCGTRSARSVDEPAVAFLP